MPGPAIERRIKWAGILIVIGLLIQMTTFLWVHPLAFIAFITLGCAPVAAGVLIYLYSLVSDEPS